MKFVLLLIASVLVLTDSALIFCGFGMVFFLKFVLVLIASVLTLIDFVVISVDLAWIFYEVCIDVDCICIDFD